MEMETTTWLAGTMMEFILLKGPSAPHALQSHSKRQSSVYGPAGLKKTKNLGFFYQAGMVEGNFSSFWPKHTSASWKVNFWRTFLLKFLLSYLVAALLSPLLLGPLCSIMVRW